MKKITEENNINIGAIVVFTFIFSWFTLSGVPVIRETTILKAKLSASTKKVIVIISKRFLTMFCLKLSHASCHKGLVIKTDKTKIIAYRIVRIGILMTIAFGFKNKVKFLARTGTKNIYPKK